MMLLYSEFVRRRMRSVPALSGASVSFAVGGSEPVAPGLMADGPVDPELEPDPGELAVDPPLPLEFWS
jgi:hypothetical protein